LKGSHFVTEKEIAGTEEIKGQCLDTMLTNLDEELKFLEEWLVSPKVEGGCIAVADTEHPTMSSGNIIKEVEKVSLNTVNRLQNERNILLVNESLTKEIASPEEVEGPEGIMKKEDSQQEGREMRTESIQGGKVKKKDKAEKKLPDLGQHEDEEDFTTKEQDIHFKTIKQQVDFYDKITRQPYALLKFQGNLS
jgi:hypothetical protein